MKKILCALILMLLVNGCVSNNNEVEKTLLPTSSEQPVATNQATITPKPTNAYDSHVN